MGAATGDKVGQQENQEGGGETCRGALHRHNLRTEFPLEEPPPLCGGAELVPEGLPGPGAAAANVASITVRDTGRVRHLADEAVSGGQAQISVL